jgi:hypothetical protein
MCAMQLAIIQARRDINSLQPAKEICAAHDLFCFATLANLNTETMSTNQPGVLSPSAPSSSCCTSLLHTFMTSMPSLFALSPPRMITAFTGILAALAARGCMPTLNVTDNECSKMVEAYIKSNKIDIHLVPPHNHCIDAAECAIAAFKEHFIAGLSMVDRSCPLQLWDDFLQQVELTLNLLCFSCHDPSKSVNEEVNGFLTSTKPQLS